MAKPKDVSDATFEESILKNTLPTLVDFWAPWCGPCRMVAPIVEELSTDYDGKVDFYKLNTDENPVIPTKFGIRGIPTLIVFKGGAEVDRIVGYRPKNELQQALDKSLAPE
ncbi:MAG: thioredoxin [Dehalococcoidia bacterium]|nr:thioredoxin [Dehalococcoidia bacterium]